ncbi:lipoprotein insertase outer membrane protein LolB [Vibrio sp. SCSIO 43136]|uniref:lipoprotein insertase outer membrane protein LolB n=1 Tax=Vibrio sp. SCSIO 43136 TaxID=2819101 RepID=UPI002075448B|nr:lipoprotein insertase outer membrane protein LolB [Vibrio sp. SCSIO 43136]USD64643.1 lipoprotein localization protein LolB [Vibrio sp. SCSIO 43136]
MQTLFELIKKRSPLRLIAILLTLFIFAGCSSLPPEPDHGVEWKLHQTQVQAITRYTLQGKMAYISPDERQSLNLYWKQTPAKSDLRLSTFLGQTALNMDFTPMHAKVEVHDGRTFEHPDINLLIKRLSGMSIPVQELTEWVKGVPAGTYDYQVSELNTLSELNTVVSGQPWTLQFERYQQVDDLLLPARITMISGDQTIKLSISKWTLNP